jgi:citrate lyase subunit beta/citryl-CoA lyase
MLVKAQTLATDMVFLDLEDAVAPDAKHDARAAVVAALTTGTWSRDRVVSVRINDASTPWALGDVSAVVAGAGAGARLDTIVLPKCTGIDHVHWLDATLRMLEAEHDLPSGAIGIDVQIEDAVGLTLIDAILAASPRMVAVHFGPGDFQASMGMPSLDLGGAVAGDDHLHHVLGRLVVAARAAQVLVLDGPHAAIADLDGLRTVAARRAAMGFDGKWVLHPSQVDVVNAAFTPDPAMFARAQRILGEYTRATSQAGGARGAVLLDGEMIDEASRKMAATIVARGVAAGLAPAPSA